MILYFLACLIGLILGILFVSRKDTMEDLIYKRLEEGHQVSIAVNNKVTIFNLRDKKLVTSHAEMVYLTEGEQNDEISMATNSLD